MRAYIDSDILIGHLRGDSKALHFLSELLFLSQFKTAPIEQTIVDAGGAIFRKWSPTHGIDINDALLTATVKQTGGKIYGLKKHYPMPEIIFEKPY